MKSFIQYLEEAFDTKPIKWKKVNNDNYYFQIDDVVYDVEFENRYNAIEVSFSIDLGPQTHKIYTLSGTGNQFKVLITVMNIIRDYIANNSDLFTKEKRGLLKIGSKGDSRTKVYTRLIKKFLPKDWNVVQGDPFRGEIEFLLGPKEYVF